MDRRYTWQQKKNGRVHLMGSNGKTLCQLEKTGAVFPIHHHAMPVDKMLCMNCAELETIEPPLRVLMGEAME